MLPANGAGGARILVVEADGIVGRHIQASLQRWGYHVVAVVPTGEEALALARAERPDLVLLEVELAGELDGVETAARLRAELDLPAVYVTALADERLLQRTQVSDPFGYVIKPFDDRSLHATLTMALHKHRLEAQLRAGEERYRAVVTQTTEGIWLFDPASMRVLESNNALQGLLGYTADELLQLTAYDIIAHDPAEVDGYVRRLEAERRVALGERRYRRKDGSLLDVEVNAVLVDFGDRRAICAVVRDVTERKRARAALERSEARYRAVVEDQTDFICRFRPDGTLTFVNEAYCRYFGRSREEVLGSNFLVEMPEAQRQELLDYLASFTPEVAVQSVVRHDIAPDGTPRWRHWTNRAFFDAAGRVVEFQSVGRDITEQKRVQAALQATAAQFRSLYENSPVMMQSIDEQGSIRNVNRKWLEVTGFSREEALGQPVEWLMAPESAARLRTVLLPRLWREGGLSDEPLQMRRRDGSVMDVLLNGSLASDTTGQRLGIAAVLDVTERRQREHELEALAALSEALRSAQTRADMVLVILSQLTGPQGVIHADGAAFALPDPATGEYVIEHGAGRWRHWTGHRLPPGQSITHCVLSTGQPYQTNDLTADPLFAMRGMAAGLSAAACVPLSAQGETIGAVWVGQRRPLAPAHMRVLTSIANMAANAMRRAALHEQTRRHAEQFAAASAIGRALAETLDLSELYERLARAISGLLPDIDSVLIYALDLAGQTATCAYGIRQHEPLPVAGLGPLSLEHLGLAAQAEVLQRGWPVTVTDFSQLPAALRERLGLPENGAASLFVPMLAKGILMGLVQVQGATHARFMQPDIELLTVVGNTAAITIQNAGLFSELQRSNLDLTRAYDATIEGWSRALDLRDKETEGHTQRVTDLAVALARRLGLPEREVVHLRRGALLHDIGKMGIPDRILRKPGPLTADEWVIMRQHPTFAYELLHPIAFLRPALDIPHCHHERWDGTGYPRGLRGEAIPRAARIFAVVDVWDALCSDRPYRPAWTQADAIAYIVNESGRHFDPTVVRAFMEMMGLEYGG